MRGKLLFITGGLIGYVLGARAGRKRYDQIAAAANNLWNAEPVQRRVTMARDFTLDAVGDLPVTLFNAGKKVARNVQGKKAAADAGSAVPQTAPKPAPRPASKSTTPPAAKATPKPASKPAADAASETSS